MPPIDIVEENVAMFVHQISSKEKVHELINVDHPYSRTFNWKQECSINGKPLAKPVKTLFMSRLPRNVHSVYYTGAGPHRHILDVETVEPPPIPPYNAAKARKAMEECERFISFANPANFSLLPNDEQDSDVEDSNGSNLEDNSDLSQSIRRIGNLNLGHKNLVKTNSETIYAQGRSNNAHSKRHSIASPTQRPRSLKSALSILRLF